MTSFLVIYELTGITDNPILKAGFFVGAIVIELIIQLTLALGLSYIRLKGIANRLGGLICLGLFAWYVLIFAVLAGVDFFSAELSASTAVYQTAETSRDLTQQRIQRIDETIATLNQQLTTEARTGYGPQSQALMAQVEKLSAEQRELTATLAETSKIAGGHKRRFQSLSVAFGRPEEHFIILNVGTLVLILYVGQILTAWRLGPKETPVITVATAPETIATPAEPAETTVPAATVAPDTAEEMDVCQNPGCNTTFPVKPGKRFCCDPCRYAAFRKKKAGDTNESTAEAKRPKIRRIN